MSDDQFISKQVAMQLANDLQISVEGYHLYNQAINNYCAEIGSLPEAIVRCKDCVHYDLFNNGTNGTCQKNIDAMAVFYPNDFCSYGERRTE